MVKTLIKNVALYVFWGLDINLSKWKIYPLKNNTIWGRNASKYREFNR